MYAQLCDRVAKIGELTGKVVGKLKESFTIVRTCNCRPADRAAETKEPVSDDDKSVEPVEFRRGAG